MDHKSKIIFFGSSKFVIPVIEVLHKNFDLALVVTTEKPKPDLALPSQTWQSYPVVKYCIKHKIPCRSVANISNLKFVTHNSELKVPVAVLADFGLFVPDSILNAFPFGIINIHPSLLPKYRGPTPVQTAILNGEKTTGVSLMKLDDQIDHGPLLAQEKTEIMAQETSENLYKRLFEKGSKLLLKVIDNYLNEDLKLIAQNHKAATYCEYLSRQSGFIDMSNPPSPDVIKRMILAYFPWPGTWTKMKINEKVLRVKFLPDNKIQVEGKKPMSHKDFINGYPEAKEILRKIYDL